MTNDNHNVSWRDFPKTAPEFYARFATEADWRACWFGPRWGSQPSQPARMWTEHAAS